MQLSSQCQAGLQAKDNDETKTTEYLNVYRSYRILVYKGAQGFVGQGRFILLPRKSTPIEREIWGCVLTPSDCLTHGVFFEAILAADEGLVIVRSGVI